MVFIILFSYRLLHRNKITSFYSTRLVHVQCSQSSLTSLQIISYHQAWPNLTIHTNTMCVCLFVCLNLSNHCHLLTLLTNMFRLSITVTPLFLVTSLHASISPVRAPYLSYIIHVLHFFFLLSIFAIFIPSIRLLAII